MSFRTKTNITLAAMKNTYRFCGNSLYTPTFTDGKGGGEPFFSDEGLQVLVGSLRARENRNCLIISLFLSLSL
jgi:hypothetical protein